MEYMVDTSSLRHAPWQGSLSMRVYRGMLLGTGGVAALLFATMAVLVCVNVLLRNIGVLSIVWSVEISEYMLMISAFLAAPWLVYTNDHIRIDILMRGMPQKNQRGFVILDDFICLIICVVLAYRSIAGMVDSATQGGMVFKVLVFPDWWLGVPMAFSFVLLTIEFARRLFFILTNRKVA